MPSNSERDFFFKISLIIIFSFFLYYYLINQLFQAYQKGYALTVARYLDEEILANRPSIRLLINASLNETELTEISHVIGEAFDQIFTSNLK